MQPTTQHRENLSAYIDGYDVESNVVEQLTHSRELATKWRNYHLIRDVMRKEAVLLDQSFSEKMANLIENEPVIIRKEAEKPKGVLLKLKRWSLPLMQAGIAASVCLMAVLGVNMFSQDNQIAQTEQLPVLQTLPFSNAIQQVSYNSPNVNQPTPEQLEYQQQRINALLQNYELQRRIDKEGVEEEKESIPVEQSLPQPTQE